MINLNKELKTKEFLQICNKLEEKAQIIKGCKMLNLCNHKFTFKDGEILYPSNIVHVRNKATLSNVQKVGNIEIVNYKSNNTENRNTQFIIDEMYSRGIIVVVSAIATAYFDNCYYLKSIDKKSKKIINDYVLYNG